MTTAPHGISFWVLIDEESWRIVRFDNDARYAQRQGNWQGLLVLPCTTRLRDRAERGEQRWTTFRRPDGVEVADVC